MCPGKWRGSGQEGCRWNSTTEEPGVCKEERLKNEDESSDENKVKGSDESWIITGMRLTLDEGQNENRWPG